MANQMTEVRLLSVPLENDYKHTLYFTSPSLRDRYFTFLAHKPAYNLSYQRKDMFVRFPGNYDELSSYNYLMYRNSEDGKWVYAFITSKKYIQEDRTDIYFEVDVLQTYLGEYTIKPSFVEREHTNDDTIGMHTLPEGLELGEYVSTYYSNDSDLQGTSIIVAATETPGGNDQGNTYTGVYSGLHYFACQSVREFEGLKKRFEDSDKTGTDAIVCMFLAPDCLFDRYEYTEGYDPFDDDVQGVDFTTGLLVRESDSPHSHTINISKNIRNDSLSSKIKNKKLFTFPYKYLLVSNNNGGSATYQYEHFSNNQIEFDIKGVLCPGGSVRLVPKNYKGRDEYNEEGLNLGKYPICNFTSDAYTNWMTQNSVNIGLNITAGVGQIIAGAVGTVSTGGVGGVIGAGQIVSGVGAIANQLGQIHQMSVTPPQSRGNINCGDVVTATHNNTFHFYGMSIKEEYIKIIDEYFTMFGYKCHRVKVPLENHRVNFWFTKTIDVSIDGGIPAEDMQTIKNCYNNGITFWKDPNLIGDYSVNNSIV